MDENRSSSRIRFAFAAAVMGAAVTCVAVRPVQADDATRAGIVTAVKLPPFEDGAPPCTAPPGLSRSLVFLQDNSREFMQGTAAGLKLAAADRNLAFSIRLANNDPAHMTADVDSLIAEKVGGAVVAPIDPDGLAPHLIDFMRGGSYVGAIVPPPATTILNAPQYKTGQVLAKVAADYIAEHYKEGANVVLLTHDTNQFLAARFDAMRDMLGALPTVNIIADISPETVDKAGGYATMKLILMANPRVDVVLGADTVVLGALKALREAGMARSDQFLGGIDGEPEAVAEVKSGTGPYKATISLNSPVFAYAMGQHAADWLEGKRIPQAMDVLPVALSKDTVADFEKDMADPRSVYEDRERRGRYLQMYGSICYDTRDTFLNFPWSSER